MSGIGWGRIGVGIGVRAVALLRCVTFLVKVLIFFGEERARDMLKGLPVPAVPGGYSPVSNISTSPPPIRIPGVMGVGGGFSISLPSNKALGPLSINPCTRMRNFDNVALSIFATSNASLPVAVSAVAERDMSLAVAEAAVEAEALEDREKNKACTGPRARQSSPQALGVGGCHAVVCQMRLWVG